MTFCPHILSTRKVGRYVRKNLCVPTVFTYYLTPKIQIKELNDDTIVITQLDFEIVNRSKTDISIDLSISDANAIIVAIEKHSMA